jgi:hypothetical protein
MVMLIAILPHAASLGGEHWPAGLPPVPGHRCGWRARWIARIAGGRSCQIGR